MLYLNFDLANNFCYNCELNIILAIICYCVYISTILNIYELFHSQLIYTHIPQPPTPCQPAPRRPPPARSAGVAKTWPRAQPAANSTTSNVLDTVSDAKRKSTSACQNFDRQNGCNRRATCEFGSPCSDQHRNSFTWRNTAKPCTPGPPSSQRRLAHLHRRLHCSSFHVLT